MSSLIITESWISLGVAILFGVMGTVSMKLSHGLRKTKPTICVAVFYTISFIAMTFAVKYIQLSVVYGVWSGVGTILVAAIGITYFDETISMRKIIFLLLIVVGVVGIHLSDSISLL